MLFSITDRNSEESKKTDKYNAGIHFRRFFSPKNKNMAAARNDDTASIDGLSDISENVAVKTSVPAPEGKNRS